MLRTQVDRFRVLAFAEGVSFLLILFITMPLKYYLDMPEPNRFVGMAHGVLFVIYVFAALRFWWKNEWNFQITCYALVASIVPFGTFYFTEKILARE